MSDQSIYCVSNLKRDDFLKIGQELNELWLFISKTGLKFELLTVLVEVREHLREIL